MIAFCEPVSDGELALSRLKISAHIPTTDLVRAMDVGIQRIKSGLHDPLATHHQVRQMYSWSDVAERTERVYADILEEERPTFVERLEK